MVAQRRRQVEQRAVGALYTAIFYLHQVARFLHKYSNSTLFYH